MAPAQTYRPDTGGRAHLADPYLDPPYRDEVWHLWRVATMCGKVLQRAVRATSADDMCRQCLAKARRHQRDHDAVQGD